MTFEDPTLLEAVFSLGMIILILVSIYTVRLQRRIDRLLGRFTALNFTEAELERLLNKGGEN